MAVEVHKSVSGKAIAIYPSIVIFVNDNENENCEKRKYNEFVNENLN